MDNITHGLLGAAIGMVRRRDGGPEHDAPLSDTDKAVTWASFLAAEMPDIDVFFGSGPIEQYIHHRGWTHSIVAAPALALVAALVTKLVWRKARLSTVFLWSLLAVLVAHLLNDWMTGWGTRLLLPFSEARLGLDWVPIVDYLYLPPLLCAVLLAWRKPHWRRRAAAGVLIYLLVYTVGYRGLVHSMVEMKVAAQYKVQSEHHMRVSPDLFNALAWQYTVDLGDRFEQGRVYPWEAVRPGLVIPKMPEDEVIRAVRSAPELKPYFDQFGFVNIQYQQVADGYLVNLGDVRYGGRGGMGLQVRLTKDLHVAGIN